MLTSSIGMSISNNNFSVSLSHEQPSKVIISVPHDGLISADFSQMFQPRKSGVMIRDLYVWPIANQIIHTSFKKGIQVDAVRFLMARTYIDVNRALTLEENLDPDAYSQVALEDWSLLDIYNCYHNELRRLVERSIQKFGVDKILLIDLHGFGKQPSIAPSQGYDLILGTANRGTVHHKSVDIDFAQFMEQKNYKIFLPKEEPVVFGGDPFNAGQTTRWYSKQYGINAIQIEIFSSFRKKDRKEQGENLSLDISDFLSLYYK